MQLRGGDHCAVEWILRTVNIQNGNIMYHNKLGCSPLSETEWHTHPAPTCINIAQTQCLNVFKNITDHPLSFTQCFSIKQAAVWLDTELTYPVVVWKFMLFHRLALKEDDPFNRLLSPSNHHFITILDFCSLSMNCPQKERDSGKRIGADLFLRFHPTWRQSLTCLRCAQQQCLWDCLTPIDVISSCDTLFGSSVLEFFFFFLSFPA